MDSEKLHERPIIITGTFSKFTHNHQVTDGAGNHAEVHADINNGQGLTYSDSVTPDGGSDIGYVSAEQSVEVGQSDSIKLSQSASDASENKASSTLHVLSGSLTGYEGYALAGLQPLPGG